VAVSRAVAAIVWAATYLGALHGRTVRSSDDAPLLVGLLLAGYPLIDAAATESERRRDTTKTTLRVDLVIDVVASAGLLVAAISLHARALLLVFGAWAVVSGLLQLARAWRAGGSRRVRLPLIISGALSAIAGIAFAASASKDIAPLAGLGGYAVLGAVLFLLWSYLARTGARHTAS